MKTVTINIYQFSELSETAQMLAIEEHGEFLNSQGIEYEDEDGEMVTDYDYEHTKEDIIESIEMNNYYFYSNGELASCVTYCGKHPKAGITELTFKNQTFVL
jgi:hypothetical protein